MKLQTLSNTYNLHFSEYHFYAEKWKKKGMYLRHIFFDCSMPETWFALNLVTMELYLYFEEYGTKKNPKLIKQGVLPRLYSDAVDYIHKIEKEIIKLYEETPISVIEELIENDELKF